MTDIQLCRNYESTIGELGDTSRELHRLARALEPGAGYWDRLEAAVLREHVQSYMQRLASVRDSLAYLLNVREEEF